MFLKGVVEDINDPLKIGRVRIRIVGKHPFKDTVNDNEKMFVNDLPWATPIFPANSSAISGECNFSVPQLGSVVVCGYFDDGDEQEPFYIGTIPLPLKIKPNTSKGFCDPSGTYPKDGLNPISKLATDPTYDKPNTLVTNTLFSEPDNAKNSVYPKNKVIETESGHVIELDDSKNNPRIRILHTSGSFIEFHSNGNIVYKSNGSGYTLIENNLNTNVAGNINTNVIGNINTKAFMENHDLGGSLEVNAEGLVKIESGGSTSIKSSSISIEGSTTCKSSFGVETAASGVLVGLSGNVLIANQGIIVSI
jgi:hypothetical protein